MTTLPASKARPGSYVLEADPDAIGAVIAHLRREWGEYGYRIVSLDSPRDGGARAEVRHFDGSRFTIEADRYGNILGVVQL